MVNLFGKAALTKSWQLITKNYQRDRYGIIMYIDYYIVQSFMTITFFKYFVNHYNFIVQYCTYKACFNMVSIWFYSACMFP